MVFAVACSAGNTGGEQPAQPAAGNVAAAETGPPPTVEELAAKLDCKPEIQVDSAEMRTGYCDNSIGKFFLSTFATQKGKDDWMDTAPEYSPHLVGNLWTALATREVLDRLKTKIGGELHLSDHRVSMTPAPPG
ncbi:hypothetical protein HNP84_009888 [Thermocatellispora tengchongensis]|uniref:Lipoprotein n=2 Tax=Thermocatellispora tengchongensis TaxID=1073253 RepID=A0A840PPX4_9ACTN|nr:hypothetical protein [Thermocatellispora tengchongensis]